MKNTPKPYKPSSSLTTISVTLFAVMILYAIFIPEPSPMQGLVGRTILAAATSGFVTSIPGLLKIELGGWLRASGALAVFILVFLVNPAQL